MIALAKLVTVVALFTAQMALCNQAMADYVGTCVPGHGHCVTPKPGTTLPTCKGAYKNASGVWVQCK